MIGRVSAAGGELRRAPKAHSHCQCTALVDAHAWANTTRSGRSFCELRCDWTFACGPLPPSANVAASWSSSARAIRTRRRLAYYQCIPGSSIQQQAWHLRSLLLEGSQGQGKPCQAFDHAPPLRGPVTSLLLGVRARLRPNCTHADAKAWQVLAPCGITAVTHVQ